MTRRRNKAHNVATTKESMRDDPDFQIKKKAKSWDLKRYYVLLAPLASVCIIIAFYPDALKTLSFMYSLSDQRPHLNDNGNEQSPATDSQTNSQSKVPSEEAKNYKPHWQKTFSVKKIFVDGRRIPPVQLVAQKETNSSVKLYIFDNILSDQECNGLINAHNRHVKEMADSPLLCFDSLNTLKQHLSEVGMKTKVTSKVFSPGTTCLNASLSNQLQTMLKSNWSYSTAFYPKESKFSTIVSQRMSEAMGLKSETGGKFQITSYPVGKAYKIHTDCVVGNPDLRDRAVSVIMYLNDVENGGETTFPDLGISVKPKKGRALVWNNMSPEGQCEPHSRHLASVVKSGSKYILMRWYYYKSFYTIGKRMAGPPQPPRGQDIPMVMCDFYTHGSCRWYDEWTPQVLTQYVQNQHAYS